MKPVEVSQSTTQEKQDDQQTVPIELRIRERAYALFEQRGRGEGHDLEDWLQAESELTMTTKAA